MEMIPILKKKRQLRSRRTFNGNFVGTFFINKIFPENFIKSITLSGQLGNFVHL